MKVSKNTVKVLNAAFAVLMIAGLSACGSRSAATSSNTSSGSTAGGGNTPTVPSQPATGNIYGLPPAPQQMFEITGTTGDTPTWSPNMSISSETKLRIKVAPLPAGNLHVIGYQNWVFPYGCMSVQVTVNGSTQTTVPMKVPGMPQNPGSPCANAPEYQILDFSSIMTGNGPVSISIHHASYDNCRTTNPYYYGCGMSQIWKNHVVGGNVTIETHNTYMAP